MSRDDWFRNTQWNAQVASQFEAKLKRARSKGQYLRIQACTLARSEPDIALQLLDRYFAQTDERLFDAQAHVDRATALLVLGRVDGALDSYESALKAEIAVPNVLTQAYLELPYTAAVRGVRGRYARALQVLEEHRGRLTFPVDHFRWNAAQAIIANDNGSRSDSLKFASAALEFATKDRSGFQHHTTIGLVSDEHGEALRQLRAFCH